MQTTTWQGVDLGLLRLMEEYWMRCATAKKLDGWLACRE